MSSEVFHEEFDKAGKKEGLQIWRIEVAFLVRL